MATEPTDDDPVLAGGRSPPTGDSRIRDHLANERTLLAWVRTSIAVMALGFVVARFGLLLRELRVPRPRQFSTGISTAFGTALVIFGALLMLLASLRYLRVSHDIDRHSFRQSPVLSLLTAALVILAALLLAVYLVLTG
jgi:putative membrane protein